MTLRVFIIRESHYYYYYYSITMNVARTLYSVKLNFNTL